MASEPVPEQLETISKELLVPFHGTFHQLVQQVSIALQLRFSDHSRDYWLNVGLLVRPGFFSQGIHLTGTKNK